MAIFHLKHSYLNWRAIPCGRKIESCLCNLLFHFFLDLDLIKIFKCMIWQSIFSFFSFLSTRLFRAMMHIVDGLSGWSTISHVGLVLTRVVFWSKGCSCHFYPKRGLWLDDVLEQWVILVSIPQGINQGDFTSIMVLELVFLVTKRVWQV